METYDQVRLVCIVINEDPACSPRTVLHVYKHVFGKLRLQDVNLWHIAY